MTKTLSSATQPANLIQHPRWRLFQPDDSAKAQTRTGGARFHRHPIAIDASPMPPILTEESNLTLADCNKPAESEAGNSHGEPVAEENDELGRHRAMPYPMSGIPDNRCQHQSCASANPDHRGDVRHPCHLHRVQLHRVRRHHRSPPPSASPTIATPVATTTATASTLRSLNAAEVEGLALQSRQTSLAALASSFAITAAVPASSRISLIFSRIDSRSPSFHKSHACSRASWCFVRFAFALSSSSCCVRDPNLLLNFGIG